MATRIYSTATAGRHRALLRLGQFAESPGPVYCHGWCSRAGLKDVHVGSISADSRSRREIIYSGGSSQAAAREVRVRQSRRPAQGPIHPAGSRLVLNAGSIACIYRMGSLVDATDLVGHIRRDQSSVGGTDAAFWQLLRSIFGFDLEFVDFRLR